MAVLIDEAGRRSEGFPTLPDLLGIIDAAQQQIQDAAQGLLTRAVHPFDGSEEAEGPETTGDVRTDDGERRSGNVFEDLTQFVRDPRVTVEAEVAAQPSAFGLVGLAGAIAVAVVLLR